MLAVVQSEFPFSDSSTELFQKAGKRTRRKRKSTSSKRAYSKSTPVDITVLCNDESIRNQFNFQFDAKTAKGTIYDVNNNKLALMQWVDVVGVDSAHQQVLLSTLSTLSEAKKGSEQYNAIMTWIDAPVVHDGAPFTFATCCKVIGIDCVEYMRDQIKSILEKSSN